MLTRMSLALTRRLLARETEDRLMEQLAICVNGSNARAHSINATVAEHDMKEMGDDRDSGRDSGSDSDSDSDSDGTSEEDLESIEGSEDATDDDFRPTSEGTTDLQSAFSPFGSGRDQEGVESRTSSEHYVERRSDDHDDFGSPGNRRAHAGNTGCTIFDPDTSVTSIQAWLSTLRASSAPAAFFPYPQLHSKDGHTRQRAKQRRLPSLDSVKPSSCSDLELYRAIHPEPSQDKLPLADTRSTVQTSIKDSVSSDLTLRPLGAPLSLSSGKSRAIEPLYPPVICYASQLERQQAFVREPLSWDDTSTTWPGSHVGRAEESDLGV